MTIRPGDPWGEVVACPDDPVLVADDAALAAHLARADGGPGEVGGVVRIAGGDLVRTVGGPSPTAGPCRCYPIDLLAVVLDGAEGDVRLAVAHVVVRTAGAGGWWRGPIWAAMNVSAHGDWDAAPRAHPDDGLVDVVEVDATMPRRARLQARRRLRTGSHVPHPAIHVRRAPAASWSGDRPLTVHLDGVAVGRARRVDVTVRPDATRVFI